MPDEWYYSHDGKHGGPVTVERLKELVASSDLLPTDWVWREGLAKWVPASTIAGVPANAGTGANSGNPAIITCCNCQAKYKVDLVQHAGAKLECEACGNTFAIRQPAAQIFLTPTPVDQPFPARLPSLGLENSRPLVSGEVTQIRQLLTGYADSVPFHGMDDFGNVVTDLTGFLIPVYRVRLRTLYEKRTTERQEQPYTGWSIPPKHVSEANVQPWTYEYPPHLDFSSMTHQHQIADSQSESPCGVCEANGIVACADCAGEGKVVCSRCGGSTSVRCDACAGHGVVRKTGTAYKRVPCQGKPATIGHLGSGLLKLLVTGPLEAASDNAAGRPHFFDDRPQTGCHNGLAVRSNRLTNEVCQYCKGAGAIELPATETYTENCPQCNQTGKLSCGNCCASGAITCSTCRGAGTVTCGACDGHKHVVSFLNVNQSFVAADTLLVVPCSQVPADVVGSLKVEDFLPVLSWSSREVPADPESHDDLRTNVPWVAENIRCLCPEARSASEPGSRIVTQEITIEQAEIRYVQFRFDGDDCKVCFVGNNGRPYPVSSAFASFTKAMVDEAAKAADQGDFAAAGIYLRQCWDIGKRDACCRAVLAGSRLNGKVLEAAKQNQAHVAKKAAALGGRYGA